MSRGASMDAISLDEWELLPDHKSSFFMEECSTVHGTVGGKDQLLFGAKLVMINMDHFTSTSHPSPYDCILDEEAKKPLLLPPLQDACACSTVHGTVGDEEAKKPLLLPPLQDACAQDPVIEFKDIGVMQAELKPGEFMPKVTEVLISGAEEEEEMIKCPAGAKGVYEDEVMVEAAPDLCEGEEGVKKDRRGLECIGFSVGKLRVNGVGALCSFGVAAATFCIFQLGGRQQQQNKQHNQKIQFQICADDGRIQQVVQQTSRLNQAMSSVMGGASTRASISFGGYYDGF